LEKVATKFSNLIKRRSVKQMDLYSIISICWFLIKKITVRRFLI